MKDRGRSLLAEALGLGEADRAEIAGALLRSLEPPENSGVEAAWRQEVQRRVAQLDRGQAETVAWDEVRDELMAKLSSRLG
jgi:putative addiction module component (TIGR02574 family)